jgi:ABC-type transport system involved in cytochrome c biogenesis permease subunit
MNELGRYFPWMILVLAGSYIITRMVPPRVEQGQMQVYEFGKLPVVDGGRIKPLDTVARNSLMQISNRQTFVDADGHKQPAVKWLLDVMTSNRFFHRSAGLEHKVFRIENDQVLDLLGLEARPGSYRYAVNEFKDKARQLLDQAALAEEVDKNLRDTYQVKVIQTARQFQLYSSLASFKAPLVVPPPEGQKEWKTLPEGLQEAELTGAGGKGAESFTRILSAYAENDAAAFNRALTSYQRHLNEQFPDEAGKADFEVLFNRFAPFYQCTLLYVAVFLLACFAWLGWTEPLNRAAFWLGVFTLVIHTWALYARMHIQGRPPVTNLYSSAVFIGWGCVVLGLTLEAIYRNGFGNIVAAVTGSLTLLIAHHLARSGDTLEMMEAVLDTNFWLATHVTCVTLGYTATFFAGFLGMLFIILGVTTPLLDKNGMKALSQMIYGTVCFATLLSFTGTVLGGIWADQSWGRFWGWDPKENGALLIVLWNALILHARWGGLVKQRGMAVLAVVGNMVTGWSWFGTNQLGVGLHAYGFNQTLAVGLLIFWVVSLVVIGLGLMPLSAWLSFAAANKPPAPVPPAAPPIEKARKRHSVSIKAR